MDDHRQILQLGYSPSDIRKMLVLGTVFVWTMLVVLNAAVSLFYYLEEGADFSWHQLMGWSLVYNLPWLGVIPATMYMSYRFPLDRSFLLKNFFIHLGTALFFCVLIACFHAYVLTVRVDMPYNRDIILTNFVYYLDLRLFLYGLLVLGYYVVDYYGKMGSASYREMILREKIDQARLDGFKNKIQPGFLLNTLTDIQQLLQASPPTADKLIADLARLIRAMLDSSREKYISVYHDLKQLEAYLNIFRLRFDREIRFEYNIDAATQQTNISAGLMTLAILEHFLSRCEKTLYNLSHILYETTAVEDGRFAIRVKLEKLNMDRKEFDAWYRKKGKKLFLDPIRNGLYEGESAELTCYSDGVLILSLILNAERDVSFFKDGKTAMEPVL